MLFEARSKPRNTHCDKPLFTQELLHRDPDRTPPIVQFNVICALVVEVASAHGRFS